jgi:hypothetical protein
LLAVGKGHAHAPAFTSFGFRRGAGPRRRQGGLPKKSENVRSAGGLSARQPPNLRPGRRLRPRTLGAAGRDRTSRCGRAEQTQIKAIRTRRAPFASCGKRTNATEVPSIALAPATEPSHRGDGKGPTRGHGTSRTSFVGGVGTSVAWSMDRLRDRYSGVPWMPTLKSIIP